MQPNETTGAYICYQKTISTSQKGAKFTHKIHYIVIIIRHFTVRHDALTYTMSDALYKAV